MKLLSRVAGLLVLLTLLILLIRGDLLSRSPIVILAQVVALVVLIWARSSFQAGQFRVVATPSGGPLLRAGPYRFIRHPMYAGLMLVGLALLLSRFSPLALVFFLLFASATFVKAKLEETLMERMHPKYRDYKRQVKMFIPYLF